MSFKKAKKGKTNKEYVIKFEENLNEELKQLQEELRNLTYKPRKLNRFVIRDPKTRTIHSSDFRDRVVYHALVNVLEPIFEKIFIYDSYANRKNKGTHNAILRFDQFKREVSNNGKLVNNAFDNNLIIGYVLKADIKKYFETVIHEILLNIIGEKIKDKKVIWLIEQILNNYYIKRKGMPLGNLTSQFFANIYLNKFDYFVKHNLKAKYYIRYVDDFVILHKNMKVLEHCKEEIEKYLKNKLKLELHPDKSKIMPLSDGIIFLGYKIFYYYKLLKKSNKRKFEREFEWKLQLFNDGIISDNEFVSILKGWFGYAIWANTYKLRKGIIEKLKRTLNNSNF